ncbi:unnamed protein product [Cuscuta epithymum]|uniref:Auxin-responsive protein n=1 Tax=Cuscuta epithymum TaxID=186058 RepID=A0AAV0GGG2_9ASTE|nr:unnamed protein product [Cuscuta epithymum]
MELELGLAPAAVTAATHFDDRIKGFDLNENNAFEVKGDRPLTKKRRFDEAFEDCGRGGVKTLMLLQWGGKPNDDDDPNEAQTKCRVYQGNLDEESIIVGWPPIRTWRKKVLHEHQGGGWVFVANNGGGGEIVVDNGRVNNGGERNSTFVKVKMEGVAIGRKVNLSLYNSYQILSNDLINMFARYRDCDENGRGYTLLYQHKEGDWLVAGDVPWMTFVGSVRRIEILKNRN